jgi:polyisoprenoid-binding protein YceI
MTGKIQFSTLIRGFEFGSQLMQDHFNENYMESDKFPKSTFSGEIVNIKNVNFGLNGTYPVTVKGVIEIHGIKKEITANGNFKIDHGSISCSSEFIVNMGDFGFAKIYFFRNLKKVHHPY